MRKRVTTDGLTVNAIAGTYVVTLGLHYAQLRPGCLGFAIQREDHTESETYWMKGGKAFLATKPHGLGPGGEVSSHEQPFQTFQWADYTAKPDHSYTYRVIPLFGQPAGLIDGQPVVVPISTEAEHTGKHGVFFNRGAVASQEYARRFLNQDPEVAGPAAFEWLSRGLLEAMLEFIRRAKDATFELHAAIYEFQWPEVLDAFHDAKGKGAKVHVIYDNIAGDGNPGPKNRQAIDDANIKGLCTPREEGSIMHNKFIVLSRNGAAVAVWTGSTNVSENGIFGHLNVGHIVEDAGVAADYRKYWTQLKGDPTPKDQRAWLGQNFPAPPAAFGTGVAPIFSPHSGDAVLEAYAALAGSASRALFMSFAFGMAKDFQTVYDQTDGVLRFALMDKFGNGAAAAQGKIDITRIRKRPNVVVAVGHSITMNAFDRWLKEKPGLKQAKNVRWVHTKVMLVDPLGPSPVILTGSANFSPASTDTNDENLLVIKGDKRVADIYLGEFLRTYTHYAFREAVAIAKENHEADFKPSDLVPSEDWQKDYFVTGQRKMRREYFAGF